MGREKCRNVMMGKLFNVIGETLASHPRSFVAVSLVFIVICSGGLYKFEIRDDVHYGYTPRSAPSNREFEIYKEFSNSPNFFYLCLAVKARDGGSLLRPAHFNATAKYGRFVSNDFKISIDGFKNFSYQTFCPGCEPNKAFTAFKNAFLEQQRKPNPDLKLLYPKSSIYGAEFLVSHNFFDVKLNSSRAATNMESSKMIVFWYVGNLANSSMKSAYTTWAIKLFEHLVQLEDPLVKVWLYEDEAASLETIRSASGAMPLFMIGVALMLLFMLAAVWLSATYYDHMALCQLWLVVTGVLSPVMASGSTFGLFAWAGVEFNSLMGITPILVLAIGVDDAFLLMHSWKRASSDVQNRMAFVMADVGPSITITSCTNALAFAVGTFTPLPQVQKFCLCTAIAIAIDFVLELTLFAPVLALVNQDSGTKPDWPRLKSMLDKALSSYANFLANLKSRVVISVFMILSLVFNAYGIFFHTEVSFSPDKTFVSDSPIAEIVRMSTHLEDYMQLTTFIVNQPPSLPNDTELSAFNEMVHKLETLKYAAGPNFTMLWLRDYESWVKQPGILDFLGLSDGPMPLSYSKVPEFMQLHTSEPFRETVKWNATKSGITIHSFCFYASYHGMTQWITRSEKAQLIRTVLASYPQFNVSMFEVDASLYDISLIVTDVTVAAVLITMVCMAIVCFFFVPGLCSLLMAMSAIASICLHTFGLLTWWDTHLGPITMVTMIITVGISVDYTAHVIYHYHASDTGLTSAERIQCTLGAVGLPMSQAAVSTLLCISLLGLHDMYTFKVFSKTLFLVVSVGWVHGLLVLPMVTAMLTDCGLKKRKVEKRNALLGTKE